MTKHRYNDEEVEKWEANPDLYDVARCGDAADELETLLTLLTSGKADDAQDEAYRMIKSWAQWKVDRAEYFGEEQ